MRERRGGGGEGRRGEEEEEERMGEEKMGGGEEERRGRRGGEEERAVMTARLGGIQATAVKENSQDVSGGLITVMTLPEHAKNTKLSRPPGMGPHTKPLCCFSLAVSTEAIDEVASGHADGKHSCGKMSMWSDV